MFGLFDKLANFQLSSICL